VSLNSTRWSLANSAVSERRLRLRLADGTFVRKRENVICLGRPGTGTTHLVCTSGSGMAGLHVRHFTRYPQLHDHRPPLNAGRASHFLRESHFQMIVDSRDGASLDAGQGVPSPHVGQPALCGVAVHSCLRRLTYYLVKTPIPSALQLPSQGRHRAGEEVLEVFGVVPLALVLPTNLSIQDGGRRLGSHSW
jgi:IstB-like ATP binding protein